MHLDDVANKYMMQLNFYKNSSICRSIEIEIRNPSTYLFRKS